MKPAKLRELTTQELRQKEDDLRRELFNLRFQAARGDIQNPKRIKTIKKDIARVLTIITQQAMTPTTPIGQAATTAQKLKSQ
ncbi:50S ribosomal protein L29 [Candidatus Magnetobacterium casense]|uniref:Large ribosomal subunit protein uL29 n=1 Tax=Candidatus Magnetobacterium casense TaxID=1455061 RepID=A0ABS6RVL3_9BACT|nr:50S ribosomal protein L29 [Candidatus Magnetobacterium casensis]MBV6340665.1 50S ribosomal protein L29 [Candidatus Magnetobacterium casensis]